MAANNVLMVLISSATLLQTRQMAHAQTTAQQATSKTQQPNPSNAHNVQP